MQQSLMNRTYPGNGRGKSSEEILAEALRERERLLKEHPELRCLQAEIDRNLEDVESSEERMLVLREMMRARLEGLFHEMSSLRQLLTGIRSGTTFDTTH